ncbi:MAG: DUF120 domain-containing protein [Candidatus Bathyarchaeia archaeon]
MKSNLWLILLKLAEQGALTKPVFTSTTALAKDFDCSQQTISRWLREMERLDLVERKMDLRGEHVSITKSGRDELMKLFTNLKTALEAKAPPSITMEGKLFTGLGEGAYYISREGYRKQFVTKVGFEPHPGTLNLKLSKPEYTTSRKELEHREGIRIEGFSNETRTYGGLICYHALINNKVKGCVLLIQRTHYDSSVIEVIAPVHLRDALQLGDGDTVRLKIFAPQASS